MPRRFLPILTVVLALAILGGLGFFVRSRFSGSNVVKDGDDNVSDYSAVFLTNGQVYFGKIQRDSTDTQLDIVDIYYLQVGNQSVQQSGSTPTPSPSASAQPDIQLVKLGKELHGPNDRMHINRQQILFTESLKNDSKVIAAIKDYTSK